MTRGPSCWLAISWRPPSGYWCCPQFLEAAWFLATGVSPSWLLISESLQSFSHCCTKIEYLYYIMLEKAMAPHSSTFAWKVPWMEESGRLQSMGSQRVGHDWATSLSLFTFTHWRRKWQPTPVFLPGESQGRGSLVAAVYGVTQSRTRLKWLSIA